MFNRKIAPKEAIERIEIIIKNSRFSQADKSALKMACDALEKQIPKKPLIINDEWAKCPACYDNKINHRKPNYCDKCGQALDWSEIE